MNLKQPYLKIEPNRVFKVFVKTSNGDNAFSNLNKENYQAENHKF